MKRIASLLGLILCSILAFAVKPARITVSISPATATLYSGATKQFTATVSGTTNAAVTWSTTAGQLRSTGAEILLAHAAMQPDALIQFVLTLWEHGACYTPAPPGAAGEFAGFHVYSTFPFL